MIDRINQIRYDSKKRMVLNMRREEYISDEMVVKRVNAAVRIELEKKRAMDVPIIVYDRDKQIIYKESSDGSRVEVGRRMRKGRYSERAAKKSLKLWFLLVRTVRERVPLLNS